jgi:PadR family transcriptional regulator, regulatory protein PadR
MPVQKNELLQGTLDMLILQTVALGANHGYGIGQRIQQISNEVLQVQQGSLYPALHRLEERNWLTAEWRETDGGRMAKFYTLTGAGRQHLETQIDNWARVAGAIQLVLGAKPEEA